MKKPINTNKRLLKEPKYKIGDIIAYKDRYLDKDDSMTVIIQSNIVGAVAYIELSEPEDELGWFYSTEEICRNGSDSLQNDDILYKLTDS